MTLIKPVAQTEDTVTLNRADYEALLSAAEDVADLAAVEAHCTHEARVGWKAARAGYLTLEEAQRLLDGESPVKVWREKRGLSQRALATRAEIGASYLAEIEGRRKPGSADALAKLARALGMRVDDLIG